MESGKMNRFVYGAFLMILTFSFLSILLADSRFNTNDKKYEQAAIELTQKLSAKVNLTSDQTDQIKDILVSYQKEVLEGESSEDKATMEESPNPDANRSSAKTDPNENANEEIQSILNDDQKAAYMEYKEEFWKEVTERVNQLKTETKIKEQY